MVERPTGTAMVNYDYTRDPRQSADIRFKFTRKIVSATRLAGSASNQTPTNIGGSDSIPKIPKTNVSYTTLPIPNLVGRAGVGVALSSNRAKIGQVR